MELARWRNVGGAPPARAQWEQLYLFICNIKKNGVQTFQNETHISHLPCMWPSASILPPYSTVIQLG